MKIRKSFVLASIAGAVCTSSAMAQNLQDIQRAFDTPRLTRQLAVEEAGERAHALRAARARIIDGRIHRVGEWYDLDPGSSAIDQPDTIYFDAFSMDPGTGLPTGFCDAGCTQANNCPGAGPTSRFSFGDNYANPFAISNMTVPTNIANAQSTRVAGAWRWRPPAPRQCIIAVITYETFNDCTTGPPGATGEYDGVVLDFGTIGAGTGYYFFDEDLTGTPLFAQMPVDGTGAYGIVIANDEDPTTGELTLEIQLGTQPMLWGTGNNTNPPQPRVGTQGEGGWDDDSPADGVHTSNECGSQVWTVDICPNPRGKMIMFFGEDPGTGLPGACCLPDGSCDFRPQAQCTAAQGIYHGDGIQCTDPSVVCRDPGACCLVDGSCVIRAEHQCDQIAGIYQGDGTDCTVQCQQPGACCLLASSPGLIQGHCVGTNQSDCGMQASATYHGAGSLCTPAACTTGNILHSNGPLATGEVHNTTFISAPPGTMWSETQGIPGCRNSLLGFSANSGPGHRLADDFTVPGTEGWNIDTVFVYGMQALPADPTPGPTPPASPFVAATLRIWDGVPGEPGSNIVWGDDTTNVLNTSDFEGLWRVGPTDHFRFPVYFLLLDVGTHLAPGTYWLDYDMQAADLGAFTPPVTLLFNRGPDAANARQFVQGAWNHIIDNGTCNSPRRQDLPFAIIGEEGPGLECYPDCNDDGVLNINDFLCFIDEFAVQSPYADCNNDGAFNINDFLCFIDEFAVGCP